MTPLGKPSRAAHQSGSSLLIVLILVLISSLLGVAAFKDSSVSLQLSNNDLQREVAFRAAEGASNRLLSADNIQLLVNSDADTRSDTSSVIDVADTEAELRLDGVGLARGFSLGEGIGTFVPYKFTARATVTLQGVSARSTVIQGAQQFVPKVQ